MLVLANTLHRVGLIALRGMNVSDVLSSEHHGEIAKRQAINSSKKAVAAV